MRMIKLFGKTVKGVIFDLDGTLLDSMWVWEQVDTDFLAENGYAVTSDYTEKVKQMHFNEAAEYTKSRYSLVQSVEEIKARWIEMVKEEYSLNIRLKDGAAEFIKRLIRRDVKIAFATTLFRQVALPCLINNGKLSGIELQKFPLVTADEVSRGKQFPDIYALAAERINVLPDECFVFEDIPIALAGAGKGGFNVCGVYDFYSNSAVEFKSLCNYYIEDFNQLFDYTEDVE